MRLALLAVATAFSIACASATPQGPELATPAVGTVGHLLRCCDGENLEFCLGAVNALGDLLFAGGLICPPAAVLQDLVDVVVRGLRDAAPDANAAVVAATAFRSAWPCGASPTSLKAALSPRGGSR